MTTAAPARLVVIVPEELTSGFALTGVDVVAASTGTEATDIARRLLREGNRGVIGIHSSLIDGFDPDLLERLRSSVSPVMIELPSGIGVEPAEVRQGRLAQRLQQAIGYHVTFGEEGS